MKIIIGFIDVEVVYAHGKNCSFYALSKICFLTLILSIDMQIEDVYDYLSKTDVELGKYHDELQDSGIMFGVLFQDVKSFMKGLFSSISSGILPITVFSERI